MQRGTNKSETKIEELPPLFPGYIAGVVGRGLSGFACRNLLRPKTNLVHFFIIGEYCHRKRDYTIYESINKGVAVGRLSMYNLDDLEIYRVYVDNWQILGQYAIEEMPELGRAHYDWWLILSLFSNIPRLLFRGKLPPWKTEDLKYTSNKAFICTEAANEGWKLIGEPIIPNGVIPLPPGFKQALDDELLISVWRGKNVKY